MARNNQHTLEQYENEEEIKDLLRLLGAEKLKSELKAPPDFRRKVLARVGQLPVRKGFFERLPAWADVRLLHFFPALGFRPVLASAVIILLSIPLIRSHYLPAFRGEATFEDPLRDPARVPSPLPASPLPSSPSVGPDQLTRVEQSSPNWPTRNDPPAPGQERNLTIRSSRQIPDTQKFIEGLTPSAASLRPGSRGLPLTEAPSPPRSRGLPLAEETSAKPKLSCERYWQQVREQSSSRGVPLTSSMRTYELYLLFADDSAQLTHDAKKALDNLGQALKSDKLSGYCFQIEGHTDNGGEPQQNLQLSQQQADSVRRYLEANYHLRERTIAVGYGQTNPIADNTTEEGRQKNRRVGIVNLGPGQEK